MLIEFVIKKKKIYKKKIINEGQLDLLLRRTTLGMPLA